MSSDYMSEYLLFTSCIYDLFDLYSVISSVVTNKKGLSTERLVRLSISCSKSKYLLFADLPARLRLFLLSYCAKIAVTRVCRLHIYYCWKLTNNQ